MDGGTLLLDLGVDAKLGGGTIRVECAVVDSAKEGDVEVVDNRREGVGALTVVDTRVDAVVHSDAELGAWANVCGGAGYPCAFMEAELSGPLERDTGGEPGP